MTPEDRAKDVVDSMGSEATMPHLWAIKIRKAITAAVEEEREACAKTAEAAIGEVPVRNSQTVAWIPDIIAANNRARYIADEIRARCNKSDGGTK